jgi:hypothetical protein
MDQKYCPRDSYQMKILYLKQEVQGHTNEFSWNLTKLVLWIYLWGGNIVQKVLDIIF